MPAQCTALVSAAYHALVSSAFGIASRAVSSGRYIHVTHDLATLIENADRIEQDDLYALRLRTLPRGP